MKIEVELRDIETYRGVVRVFRGWQTAQTWIEEALLASGPEIEVIVKEYKDLEPELLQEAELPFQDTDFDD